MQITQQQLAGFDTIVQNLIVTWNKLKPIGTNSGWFGVNKTGLSKGFSTVLDGVEQLVEFASNLEVPGTDKKAAVLAAANTLFNEIVASQLPTWVSPFMPIATQLFDSALDAIIEFVVKKMVVSAPVNKVS